MDKGDGSINPFSVFGNGSDMGADADMDMDISSSSPPMAAPGPSRATRFQPKSKFKPKPSLPSHDPKPIETRPHLPLKKQEEPPAAPPLKPVKKEDPFPVTFANAVKEKSEEDLMDEDGAFENDTTPTHVQTSPQQLTASTEDRVVREIDVFLSPSPIDANTQLYIMQYPLRPCWRPYEFNERCEEVRVKPKHSKVEVDLTVDINSENYDNEAAAYLKLQKQTLSSSKAPLATGYAVGILKANKLHLNPVHAVVQLKPSMAYLKKGRNVGGSIPLATNSGKGNKEESAKLLMMQGKSAIAIADDQQTSIELYADLKREEDAEPWIALKYHGADSSFSDIYRQKMVPENSGQIEFGMSSFDYINSLVPGRSNAPLTGGLSRRLLETLPLEERFKLLFSEGPSQVLRFEVLVRLAPAGSTEQEILNVLQQHSHLVQGLWVSKSPLRFEGFQSMVRDYILLLFSKNRVISQEQLKAIKVSKEVLKNILDPLAIERSLIKGSDVPFIEIGPVERSALKAWVFKQETDKFFIESHPDIVKEQDRYWSIHGKHITDAAYGLGKSIPSMSRNPLRPVVNATISKTVPSVNVDQGVRKRAEGLQALEKLTMSDETREALPKALREIFKKYSVCSLQLICQGLRDLAVSKSSQPKSSYAKAAVAAALGASAPLPELQSVISQVAITIHNVYVLKSLNDAAVDPYRDVVISLLSTKDPNAKLKKVEIVEACKFALKMEIPKPIYTQVLSELCVWKGNAWVMKTGDGKPA